VTHPKAVDVVVVDAGNAATVSSACSDEDDAIISDVSPYRRINFRGGPIERI
jgi:hypothetical protein